jgi:DNA-binding LacI/PurR family transcriptional regulator
MISLALPDEDKLIRRSLKEGGKAMQATASIQQAVDGIFCVNDLRLESFYLFITNK